MITLALSGSPKSKDAAKARKILKSLKDAGFTINAHWLTNPDTEASGLAAQYLDDVVKSDGLVILPTDHSCVMVSMGAALAHNIPVFLVGEPCAPHHELSVVQKVDTVKALIQILEEV